MASEWPLVGRAHPQVVGRDGAQFGDEEMRCDVIAQSFNCENRLVSVLQRNQVLALQLRPLDGVKFMRKCGRRSYQGPGIPCCSVQLSASWPASG